MEHRFGRVRNVISTNLYQLYRAGSTVVEIIICKNCEQKVQDIFEIVLFFSPRIPDIGTKIFTR